MKKTLTKSVESLRRGRTNAYIRRAMWSDFEKRLRDSFSKLSANKAELNALGRAYILSNKEYSPLNKKNIYTFNSINQIQISLGWRHLGVYTAVHENKESKSELVAESGASIWFSQNIFGHVMVFVSPYSSKVLSVDEKDIALGYYKWPTDLNNKEIEKLIKIFLRYCVLTSADCEPSALNYFFRLKLRYSDFRNKKSIRSFYFGIFERWLLPLSAIIATLYAGSKIWYT